MWARNTENIANVPSTKRVVGVSKWETQFKRMIRALAKLEKTNSDEDVEFDDMYFFFQNCWHLKDWIANDDDLPQSTRYAIAQAAEKIESLKFCADLANGSKHLKLKSARKGAWIGRLSITNDKGEAVSSVELRYAVYSDQGWSTPANVTGFARQCIQDWKDLLAVHGLLSDANLREPA